MADPIIHVPGATLPPPPPPAPGRGPFTAPSRGWIGPPSPPAANNGQGRRGLRFQWKLWLARRTGLLLYGETGLSPAAQKHLTTASFLLAALWFIDVLAWFGLWNLLLNGSLRAIKPLTAVAAVLGLLLATAILHYESSFLTTDLRRSTRPKLSISIRVCLIVFAAIATSLPVEMYLLEDQINARLHQEKVLAQIPALVQRWGQAKERMSGNEVTKKERDAATVPQREAVAAASRQRQQASSDFAAVQSEVSAQRRQVFGLENRLAQALENRLAQPVEQTEVDRLTSLVANARAALNRLQSREQALADAMATARSRESQADLAFKVEDAKISAVQTRDASVETRRYETWLHDLWNAPSRQVVQERGAPANDRLVYDGEAIEGHIGVGEQLIVLTDVLQGAPPRRPRISTQDQAELKNMKIALFIEDDVQGATRQQEEASSLRRLVLVTLFGFMFVPALIFASKFLFDDDTRAYLDSDYQRELGNPAVPQAPSQATSGAPLL